MSVCVGMRFKWPLLKLRQTVTWGQPFWATNYIAQGVGRKRIDGARLVGDLQSGQTQQFVLVR